MSVPYFNLTPTVSKFLKLISLSDSEKDDLRGAISSSPKTQILGSAPLSQQVAVSAEALTGVSGFSNALKWFAATGVAGNSKTIEIIKYGGFGPHGLRRDGNVYKFGISDMQNVNCIVSGGSSQLNAHFSGVYVNLPLEGYDMDGWKVYQKSGSPNIRFRIFYSVNIPYWMLEDTDLTYGDYKWLSSTPAVIHPSGDPLGHPANHSYTALSTGNNGSASISGIAVTGTRYTAYLSATTVASNVNAKILEGGTDLSSCQVFESDGDGEVISEGPISFSGGLNGSAGTPGFLGQFGVHGARLYKVTSASPIVWKEMLTVDTTSLTLQSLTTNSATFRRGTGTIALSPNLAFTSGFQNIYLPSANGTIALDSTAMMLAGIQTITGAKTFSGLLKASNQTLASPENVVNSKLLRDHLGDHHNRTIYTTGSSFTQTFANGGGFSATDDCLVVTSGTSINGSAHLRTGQNLPSRFLPGGDGIVWDYGASGTAGGINFSTPFSLSFRLTHSTPSPGTAAVKNDTLGYIKLGEAFSNNAVTELASKGIGIYLSGGNLYGAIHNGTTHIVGNVSLGAVGAAPYPVRAIVIVCRGGGVFEFYSNGILIETLTNGPVGYTGNGNSGFSISIKNSAAASPVSTSLIMPRGAALTFL